MKQILPPTLPTFVKRVPVRAFFLSAALLTLPLSGQEKSVIFKNKKFDITYQNQIKTVSRPIVYTDGILFTFSHKNAKRVYVSGSFVGWRKQIELSQNDYGIFYRFYKREINAGSYEYRYYVDGIWMNDPHQSSFRDDGYGTRISVIDIPTALRIYTDSPMRLNNGLYRFFLKDAGYKEVSWIGSANTWDSSITPMKLKNGYWVIDLRISKDKIFYKFYVDGKRILDPQNLFVARMKFGEQVSYVRLPNSSGNVRKGSKR